MTVPNKIKSLEFRIQILRDKIVEQATTFDKMQNKMFALVGLLLTLGGLLTYDIFRVNFPDSIIEFMVFISALVFLGSSAFLVGFDYRAKKSWSVPIGAAEEVKLDSATDYLASLEIIHSDYILVYQDRDKTLDRKAKFLNGSFHLFVVGVILLIAFKIGG